MAYKIRKRNLFDASSSGPYKLSRTRLENYVRCPRCFYLDRRLGVDRVQGPGWLLNTATDTLLKKEFDTYRIAGTPHPMFSRYDIDAVPFVHPELDVWRSNFMGIQYLHKETGLMITGAIDDIWQNADQSLAIVDYKSTSTNKEITLEDKWKQAFKRQMEIYQWLFRQNGYAVDDTGYFFYVNADTNREAFDGQLVFETEIIAYKGDDSWVDDTVNAAHACLMAEELPESSSDCEWCAYRRSAVEVGDGVTSS